MISPKSTITTFVALALPMLSPNLATAGEQSAASGTFSGASNHITTGGVTVVKTANGGAVVILDADFSLDGAPDPSVGFGNNGKYVSATDLGDLSNNTGLQVYVVPASVNIDDFNEVYIWCSEANVPLGVAPLDDTSS